MGFSLSTLVKQKTWEGGKSQSIFRKLTGRVEGRGRGRDETGHDSHPEPLGVVTPTHGSLSWVLSPPSLPPLRQRLLAVSGVCVCVCTSDSTKTE